MRNKVGEPGNRELTQYVITKWSLVSSMSERGVRMVVVFKRRVTNELLTTYLPSLLLILTTYCTTFFKPFYFEAAVTVNLTTMLGLAFHQIHFIQI